MLRFTTSLLLLALSAGCAAPRERTELSADHEAPSPSSARIDLDADLLVSALRLRRDAWIGQLGCGSGAFTRALAEACSEGLLFAADLDAERLAEACASWTSEPPGNVVPVFVHELPPLYPAGRLDLLFLAEEPERILSSRDELRRLGAALTLEGRLAFHAPELSEAKLERLARTFREAGYEPDHEVRVHGLHVWKPNNQW